ncbi:MAG TPA: ribonuclease P protein component [Candidatus Angelobacter sp.]
MSGNHPQPLQRFPKSLRLLRHADFQAVYKEGRKHFSGNITVFYRLRAEATGPRVGFTVGKVLGGAVQRNRIRRRMRAVVQRHLSGILLPLDVVIHPRKTVLDMDFDRLDAEVEQVLAIIQKGKTK